MRQLVARRRSWGGADETNAAASAGSHHELASHDLLRAQLVASEWLHEGTRPFRDHAEPPTPTPTRPERRPSVGLRGAELLPSGGGDVLGQEAGEDGPGHGLHETATKRRRLKAEARWPD